MKIYLAPLEGITGYVYRNAYREIFGDVDKYYAPFVNPNQNAFLNKKEKRDLLPENNKDINLVPQVMTNNSDYFLGCQKELIDLGYKEVNINLGCPSGTVVTKKKGSGFLYYTDELDEFLYKIFEKSECDISVKTRIGRDEPEEFYKLLEIYNKYKISELTIHPRIRTDFYNNQPNMDIFDVAYNQSKNPLVYNGDIKSKKYYENIVNKYPNLEAIMIGRGIIGNPCLVRSLNEYNENDIINIEETRLLIDRLKNDYYNLMKDERNTLFKLKEIWLYICENSNEGERIWKKMKKVKNFNEYDKVLESLGW